MASQVLVWPVAPAVHDVGEATHYFGVEVRLELNRAPGSVGRGEVGLDGSQRTRNVCSSAMPSCGALDPDMSTTSHGRWVTWGL